MNKLFSKAKAALHEHTNSNHDNFPQPPQGSSTIQSPTPLDVIRFRYHHGTNLGSIFVLEQWLHRSMFPENCPGTGSEHDAVKESIKQSGVEATRQKWENHWNSAISDNDFEWLVNEARCTSIRLPIGYFTLGTEFCKDTPFEDVKDVYVNAWMAVRELVARARSWGIGVLLDFHALPGGANGESHSGTSTGKAELWGKRRYLDCASRCIALMARDIREGKLDGVIGLQLVNEAPWDAKGMYDWYTSTINTVSKIDSSIPIYISDGWDLERALKWSNGRRGKGPGNPVIIDTHKYYTFSDSDRSQTPQQIIARVPNELNELNDKEGSIWDRGEAQIIIGEWSCVLDGQTWSRVGSEEKDGLVRQFGMAQSWKWSERTGGSYFWTYKMDWMPGGEWGFTSQTQQNNITPPDFLKLSHQETTQRSHTARNQKDQLLNQALSSHTEYWDRTSLGTQFQHHLYGLGYDLGYSDALAFFAMRGEGGFGEKGREAGGGDKIGCLEVWIGKRLGEFMRGERSDGERELGWEWEQGFRAGVKGFYGCAGI